MRCFIGLLTILFVLPVEARSLSPVSWAALRSSLKGAKQLQSRSKKLRKRKRRKARRRGRRRYVQLKNGLGLRVLNQKRAWGRSFMVSRLTEIMAGFKFRFPEARPMIVHDLSNRWGGRMRPHKSHRTGRDVDIRLPLNRPTHRYAKATPRTLHLEHTWYLVSQLINTCEVEYIFLDRRLQRALYRFARRKGIERSHLAGIMQYPSRRSVGILRHAKGHRDHIHVRFRYPRQRRLHASFTTYCGKRQNDALLAWNRDRIPYSNSTK